MKSLFNLFSKSCSMNFHKNKVSSVVGKAFIVFGFVFLIPGISHSKIKIDREAVEAVNAGIQSIDDMELVLKYFFKKPKDRRQIDRDLAQMAKLIHKVKWYAEAGGHDELLVKSKKKVLFKFRLLSEGKEFKDFAFNINGRKFAIDTSRSYAWHTKKLGNILGLSRTSLFETLLIREARAFSYLLPLVAATVGAITWSRRAKANQATTNKDR